jgi:FkbM family methyltransferase
MSLVNKLKALLDQPALRSSLGSVATCLAQCQGYGVKRIFYDDGVWIHQTSRGHFAYHQPYVRLNLARLDAIATRNFFWGYTPRPGDVILDVGAGVGEETLTFSRAVGAAGKVICIEAHPRTFRCLEKLIQYNCLQNVTAVHLAVTQPFCLTATIEDSDEYLTNRLNPATGISITCATLDAIHQRLSLGHIDFLKMNIEGAERLAIRGMVETLKHTAIVCISCHDFLANDAPRNSSHTRDDHLRTKTPVRHFLEQGGFQVVTRSEPHLPPFLRDQVWAYNPASFDKLAG